MNCEHGNWKANCGICWNEKQKQESDAFYMRAADKANSYPYSNKMGSYGSGGNSQHDDYQDSDYDV